MIQFDDFFQMGWNHQLVRNWVFCLYKLCTVPQEVDRLKLNGWWVYQVLALSGSSTSTTDAALADCWWEGNTWYSRGRHQCWCHWCGVFRCNIVGMPGILRNNTDNLFRITDTSARADDFMPSVMTCANYLKLPEWAMETCLEKFVISLNNP